MKMIYAFLTIRLYTNQGIEGDRIFTINYKLDGNSREGNSGPAFDLDYTIFTNVIEGISVIISDINVTYKDIYTSQTGYVAFNSSPTTVKYSTEMRGTLH